MPTEPRFSKQWRFTADLRETFQPGENIDHLSFRPAHVWDALVIIAVGVPGPIDPWKHAPRIRLRLHPKDRDPFLVLDIPSGLAGWERPLKRPIVLHETDKLVVVSTYPVNIYAVAERYEKETS